jgi:NADPH2:quinone reductase
MWAATYRESGPADTVLRVEEIPVPKPGLGQVRVKIAYSAINPTDVKTRSGLTPRQIADLQVPHMDGSGVIDAVGPDVPANRVGERVWVMLAAQDNPWGTAAEWAVVPAKRAIPLDGDTPLDLAALLGVPAVTAAHCLLSGGAIAGKTILVSGGAGAVGRCAIELGNWLGAHVIATASTPEKQQIAAAAGAAHVFDYRQPDVAATIAAAAPKIDRIIEVALAVNLDLDLQISSPGTVVVSYATDSEDPVLPIRRCMTAGIILEFMLLYALPPAQMSAAVQCVSDALVAGALTMPPVQRFALADIVAAQQAQEAGPVGRILVDINPDAPDV